MQVQLLLKVQHHKLSSSSAENDWHKPIKKLPTKRPRFYISLKQPHTTTSKGFITNILYINISSMLLLYYKNTALIFYIITRVYFPAVSMPCAVIIIKL